MSAAIDALIATVVGGLLAVASYMLWLHAQDWAQNTPLADFPFLAGLVAVFVFLSLADWALTRCATWFGRGH
jgi:hypothetical protein